MFHNCGNFIFQIRNTICPDFSQDPKKEGSKTAKMYIARQSQQLKT
jgi:hypothetical protein